MNLGAIRSTCERLADIVLGVLLAVVGCAMLVGLYLLTMLPKQDVWDAVGIALGASLYTFVAELFIFLGLERILGPRSFLTKLVAKSLMVFTIALALTAITIVVCILIIIW